MSDQPQENFVSIEYSDGTKAIIVVDDDIATNIAGAIEQMTGLDMDGQEAPFGPLWWREP